MEERVEDEGHRFLLLQDYGDKPIGAHHLLTIDGGISIQRFGTDMIFKTKDNVPSEAVKNLL